MTRSPAPGERGQASIELLAVAPLLVLVALAAAQALAALACREYAAHGAHAGAVALLQGADPARAARAALPGWSRSDVRVMSAGRRIVVRVRPPFAIPGLEALLTTERAADAGPPA